MEERHDCWSRELMSSLLWSESELFIDLPNGGGNGGKVVRKRGGEDENM